MMAASPLTYSLSLTLTHTVSLYTISQHHLILSSFPSTIQGEAKVKKHNHETNSNETKRNEQAMQEEQTG